MRRIYILLTALVLIFALGCLLSACGEAEQTGAYSVYYINRDVSSLVEKKVDLTSNELNTNGMIDEFITLLDTEIEDVECQPALMGDLMVKRYEVDHNTLYLYLSDDYSVMTTEGQLLCRAALVKTLVQVTDVDAVYFYVAGVPLTDSNGSMVGILTADSFLENPGSQINYADTTTLTLYYSDESGRNLVAEKQTVHYVSNISMEKLVIEQLIAGPESDGLQATIPQSTKIISVSTVDGTCYVNLDDGFTAQNYDVSEDVVIYSIVDSLFALNNGIGRVMITVNGESNFIYRESISLDQFFYKNLDLILSDDSKTREAEVKRTDE